MTDAEIEAIAANVADLVRSRLRACQGALNGEQITSNDRLYTPGPYTAQWVHVSVFADWLKMSDAAAWRLAYDAAAQWPFGKRARRVDVSKFRDLLPNLQNIAKLGT